MRFQIAFWFWVAAAGAQAVVGSMTKRLWHLLFDDRWFAWRTSRIVDAWGCWHPSIGLSFDFYIEFIPPHKADPNDEHDMSWGPEFKFGFGLPWIDFGLLIPNGDHPDNDIEIPKRYCGCGREASTRFKLTCEGCQNVPDLCVCETLGLKVGGDVSPHYTETDGNAHV